MKDLYVELKKRAKRRAVVVWDDGYSVGTTSIVVYTDDRVRDKIRHNHIKDIIIIAVDPEDLNNWAECVHKDWGVIPLDMTAGREKYPELFL